MRKITLIDTIKDKIYVLPNQQEISLGRAVENDIQIIDSGISRKHCKIYNISDKLGVMDVGSKNGTYINNTEILQNRMYLLKDGFKLKLCNYLLEVKISDEENSGDLTEVENKIKQEIKRAKSGDSDTAYDFTKDVD